METDLQTSSKIRQETPAETGAPGSAAVVASTKDRLPEAISYLGGHAMAMMLVATGQSAEVAANHARYKVNYRKLLAEMAERMDSSLLAAKIMNDLYFGNPQAYAKADPKGLLKLFKSRGDYAAILAAPAALGYVKEGGSGETVLDVERLMAYSLGSEIPTAVIKVCEMAGKCDLAAVERVGAMGAEKTAAMLLKFVPRDAGSVSDALADAMSSSGMAEEIIANIGLFDTKQHQKIAENLVRANRAEEVMRRVGELSGVSDRDQLLYVAAQSSQSGIALHYFYNGWCTKKNCQPFAIELVKVGEYGSVFKRLKDYFHYVDQVTLALEMIKHGHAEALLSPTDGMAKFLGTLLPKACATCLDSQKMAELALAGAKYFNLEARFETVINCWNLKKYELVRSYAKNLNFRLRDWNEVSLLAKREKINPDAPSQLAKLAV